MIDTYEIAVELEDLEDQFGEPVVIFPPDHSQGDSNAEAI